MEEVTFGLPVPNRANGAYKRTAGLFVNQSPVKFCAERNLSFAEFIAINVSPPAKFVGP